MKKKWKIILGAAVLLVILVFAVTQALQGVEAEVKKAAPRDIAKSFTEDGVVVPLQEREVYSLHTARVEELLVQEGDEVSRGDLLAALDQRKLEYTQEELHAQLDSLEGEMIQLEEEPSPSQQKSYELRVDEAEDSLEAAKRELERMDTLYREDYELRVEEAEENLETAQRNYERTKNLYEKEFVSQVEYEEAGEALTKAENQLARQEQALQVFSEAEYEEAEEMVKKAEYNLAQQEKALQVLHESYQPPQGSEEVLEAKKEALEARLDLVKYQKDHHIITAPIEGVVADINLKEGEIADPQTSMMRVFHQQENQVEVNVLSRDIFSVSEGMPVKLELKLRDKEVEFPGVVVEIAPYAQKDRSPLGLEEERVKVTVKPDIPRDINVAPGYKLDVEFTTEERADELVVLNSALFSYNGEDALLVVENGRAATRKVTTGLETTSKTVITDGLEEGDLVILDPQNEDFTEGERISYFIVEDGEGTL